MWPFKSTPEPNGLEREMNELILKAIESLTIAKEAMSDGTTPDQKTELAKAWSTVLAELDTADQMQKYLWTVLTVSSTAIESLLDLCIQVRDITVRGSLEAVGVPSFMVDQMITSLPDMSDDLNFGKFMQSASFSAISTFDKGQADGAS